MIKQLCTAALLCMPFYATSMQLNDSTHAIEQRITKDIAGLKKNLVEIQLKNAENVASSAYNAEERDIVRQLSQLLSQLNIVQLTNATNQYALVSQTKNK